MALAIKHSGMTLAEVAERAHVKPSWLSAVKNDRILPQVDQLKAIALASGDPLGYLTEPMGLLPIEETQNADWRSVILRIHQLTDDQKQSLVVLINSMVNGKAK